jgi:hypothetical protein
MTDSHTFDHLAYNPSGEEGSEGDVNVSLSFVEHLLQHYFLLDLVILQAILFTRILLLMNSFGVAAA